MEKFELDCRTFEFSKWVLPKTKSYIDDKNLNKSITVGYFDFVKVNKIDVNNGEHPLEKYIILKKNTLCSEINNEDCQNEALDYTSQQFLAFTNVADTEDINRAVYKKSKLEAFWKEQSVIRYYSFLHIQDASNVHTIYNTVGKINKLFSQKNNCDKYIAVCYFSLDYSDIIICSNNLSISEFSKVIFRLNYEYSKFDKSSNSKLIKDSFSLLSINQSFSKNIYNLVKNNLSLSYSEFKDLIQLEFSKKYNISQYINDEFHSAFNLGVQNYETFKLLFEKLIKKDLIVPNDTYKMLGRHDITIVNQSANLFWLVIMQSIIDLYSTEDKNTGYTIKSVIFNCETYIRIPFDENETYTDCEIKKEKDWPENYNAAYKILDEKVKKYIKISGLETEHISPVITLKNSILGLLKSEFAEDFVLCIFESFISFLDYMHEKASGNYNSDKEFDRCFDNYFDTINSLINSAMHSDRQFIQSPSFNPVFYDVPPKLMAFYTAVSSKINSILRTNDDESYYSFVFRPSFARNIRVNYYSYYEAAPADRLLTVTINENDLYYPYTVLIQICHEIAHFVGDANRCRKTRKERLLKSSLFALMYNFLITKFDNLKSDKGIIEWINKSFSVISQKDYYITSNDYLGGFYNLYYMVIQDLAENKQYSNFNKSIFKEYYESLSEIKFESINDEFVKYLKQEQLNTLANYKNNNDISILISIYSEIYADLQMIIIFDLSEDDYLFTFKEFFESKGDIHNYTNIYYRILNIVMFMIFIGKWKVEKNVSEITNMIYQDINNYINYFGVQNFKQTASKMYNNNVNNIIEELSVYGKSNWKGREYWFVNNQHYLLDAYSKSTNWYNFEDNFDEINRLRDEINIIKEFDNAVEVFCLIQETNEKYAEKIFKLQNPNLNVQ